MSESRDKHSLVLVELVEKLGQALKDEKELTTAVGKHFQVQFLPKEPKLPEVSKTIARETK